MMLFEEINKQLRKQKKNKKKYDIEILVKKNRKKKNKQLAFYLGDKKRESSKKILLSRIKKETYDTLELAEEIYNMTNILIFNIECDKEYFINYLNKKIYLEYYNKNYSKYYSKYYSKKKNNSNIKKKCTLYSIGKDILKPNLDEYLNKKESTDEVDDDESIEKKCSDKINKFYNNHEEDYIKKLIISPNIFVFIYLCTSCNNAKKKLKIFKKMFKKKFTINEVKQFYFELNKFLKLNKDNKYNKHELLGYDFLENRFKLNRVIKIMNFLKEDVKMFEKYPIAEFCLEMFLAIPDIELSINEINKFFKEKFYKRPKKLVEQFQKIDSYLRIVYHKINILIDELTDILIESNIKLNESKGIKSNNISDYEDLEIYDIEEAEEILENALKIENMYLKFSSKNIFSFKKDIRKQKQSEIMIFRNTRKNNMKFKWNEEFICRVVETFKLCSYDIN